MKIWLLTQDQNRGYDTYDSVIVTAETEDEARKTWPGFGNARWEGDIDDGRWVDENGAALSYYSTDYWATHIHLITVIELGTANEGIAAGVQLASFNAG